MPPPRETSALYVLDLVCPNCGANNPPEPGDSADCRKCSYPILRPEHLKTKAVEAWMGRVLPRATGEAA